MSLYKTFDVPTNFKPIDVDRVAAWFLRALKGPDEAKRVFAEIEREKRFRDLEPREAKLLKKFMTVLGQAFPGPDPHEELLGRLADALDEISGRLDALEADEALLGSLSDALGKISDRLAALEARFPSPTRKGIKP